MTGGYNLQLGVVNSILRMGISSIEEKNEREQQLDGPAGSGKSTVAKIVAQEIREMVETR